MMIFTYYTYLDGTSKHNPSVNFIIKLYLFLPTFLLSLNSFEMFFIHSTDVFSRHWYTVLLLQFA